MATEKEKKEVEIVINGAKADATLKEMQTSLRVLNAQFSGLKKGSQEWKDKMQEVGKQDALIRNVKNEIRGVSESMQNAKKETSAFGGVFASVFGAITFTRLIGEAISFVQAGIKLKAVYSDAFSDIQKSTGMTAAEVKGLNEELGKLDTRTKQLDLLDIAKVGGQIGIAKDEIEGFTVSVDKAVVALGDEFQGGAEEVAKSMGTLKQLFKETKDLDAGTAINQIGSAINELGSAGMATGPVVAEFAARIGQLGDLAPQIDQTLGLGAAMQELGLSAEIAGGGLTNIFLQAGKESAAFAKQLGMTQQEFKSILNTDPNEMLLKLAESMKGMSNTNIIATMDNLKLGTQESVKVMSLLANQTDLVREKQQLASKAMQEATSLTAEFNIKNNNEAAILAKTEKEWEKMKVTIGDKFMPIVGDGMRILIPLLQGLTKGFITFINIMKALPSFVSENKELFIGLGIALVSLNTAQIAATASTLYHTAVEKARAIATKSTTAAQWLLNAAMTANPIGLVIAGVALLITGFIALYKNSESVRAGLSGLGNAALQIFNNIKDNAMKILGGVGKLLAGVFTFSPSMIKSALKDLQVIGEGAGEAYNKGYKEKIDAEAQAKKAATKKRAEEEGNIERETKQKSLDDQLADIQKNNNVKEVLTIKEQKKRAAAQRKADKEEAAEAKKAADDQIKAAELISEKKIALIADEYDRKIAQINAGADKEIQNLVGTEAQKTELLKLIEQDRSNQLSALKKERDEQELQAAIELENRKASALAELKLMQAEETGSPEDILEAQLEQMELEREMKLEDHTLLKEEIDLINEEFDQKERDAADAMAAYKKQKTLDVVNTGLQMASQLTTAINSLQQAETNKKLDDAEKVKNSRIQKLDEELAAGSISKATYEAEKAKVEEEYAKKTDKLKAEQQKKNKKAAMIQALINTALSITSALGGVWPAAIAFAAIAAVMGGLQIAAIAKQPDSSFKDGGFTAKKPKSPFKKWSDIIDHFAVGGYTGGSQASFKDGGWVRTRKIGEIGEAGSEYVSPHWMITSPKYANIFGYLESERQRRKFAAGGFTDTASAAQAPTIGQTANSVAETDSKLDLVISEVQGLRSDMNGWQSKLRVELPIVEVDEGLNELGKIRAESVIS